MNCFENVILIAENLNHQRRRLAFPLIMGMKQSKNQIRQLSNISLNISILRLFPEVGSSGNGSEIYQKSMSSPMHSYYTAIKRPIY